VILDETYEAPELLDLGEATKFILGATMENTKTLTTFIVFTCVRRGSCTRKVGSECIPPVLRNLT